MQTRATRRVGEVTGARGIKLQFGKKGLEFRAAQLPVLIAIEFLLDAVDQAGAGRAQTGHLAKQALCVIDHVTLAP